MDRKKVELFWKRPGRYIFILFLAVVVFCTLFTFMPKWFNSVCTILLTVLLIKKAIKFEHEEEKKHNKKNVK